MARSHVIWLFALLAAIFAAPFLREACKPKMADKARRGAPGQFAELTQGLTHYQLSGPKDGHCVVLIHGLTTPSFVWYAVSADLAAHGFRTLTYDLYGRGYSDRPAGPQDAAFFLRQLDDLLAHLGLKQPIHFIGYSMGGAIAASCVAARPDRAERLILIAPAGMQVPGTGMIRFIRDRGLLGAWAMFLLFPHQMRKDLRVERDLVSAVSGITDLQKRQLRFRGFVPSVLASLRGILARPLESEHLTIKRKGPPVLAIWGEDDSVISTSAMTQLSIWNDHATHEVIVNAGHGLPYTHAKEVGDKIKAFLLARPRNTRSDF